ncbi:MAG: CotH kinase family protein [Balneolales bacterium]
MIKKICIRLSWVIFYVNLSAGLSIAQGVAEEPGFSHQAGFYNTGFDLEIASSVENSTIYYTTDGSMPTESSSVYTVPIPITDRVGEPNGISMIRTNPIETDDLWFGWKEPGNEIFKITVIRARVFTEDSDPSQTITRTYLVDENINQRYTLPIVSIAADSVDLFSDDKGIYVPGDIYKENGYGDNRWGEPNANYHQRGSEWEREVNVEFFDEAGNPVLSQKAGLRIHGGGTRAMANKSLRLYARSEYGVNRFNYKFFDEVPHSSYNRLLLRNSGQDGYNYPTLFRDALMQKLVGHLRFDTQAYQPYIVFINGEYWGIHNLRERYDKHYLERNYGVDEEQIDLLEKNRAVVEGSSDHYDSMIEFIENHTMADPDNFQYIKTQMDVDNFMDYSISQIYFRNDDWPGNNIDYWRSKSSDPDAPPGLDGRWRWLLYDTDFGYGFGGTEQYTHNTLDMATEAGNDSWPNQDWATFLLRNLLQNDEFKNAFINRFAELLNTAFKPERVVQLISDMQDVLEPEIQDHVARWSYPVSIDNWEANIGGMRKFAQNRPDYQRNHIISHFNIDGMSTITVDVSNSNGGSIQINELDLAGDNPGVNANPYPWKGTYFRDIPVTIIARPYPGYRFLHWEGIAGQESTLTLTLDEDVQVTAVFEIDEDYEFVDQTIVPHPLNDGNYVFTSWEDIEPAGTYPPNMAFLYMDRNDPGMNANTGGVTEGGYNLDSRTRINGLGEDGFSFINTGNEDGNPGYPGTRLGGALLAVDTRGVDDLYITWTGGTIQPNSRIYNLRLQYRVGNEADFIDLKDQYGKLVEYKPNDEAGHSEIIGPVRLPEWTRNKPYVQFRWRYYYTEQRIDQEIGQRSQLRIDDIRVETEPMGLKTHPLKPINGEKVGFEDIHLMWEGSDAANSYAIQISKTTDFENAEIMEFETINDTTLAVLQLNPSTRYYWRVKGENNYGYGIWSEPQQFETTDSSQPSLPTEVKLLMNYPNPFNNSTTISFGLPDEAQVQLDVYDLIGRQVTVLTNNTYTEGYHQVAFDADGLSSGIYFYRLQTESKNITRKMLLIK